MKHYLTAILFLLACQVSAQNVPIDGIWKFKVDVTTVKFLDTLGSLIKRKVIEVDNDKELNSIIYNDKKKKSYIIGLKRNVKNKDVSPSYAPNNPRVKVYEINDFKMGDIYQIGGMKLTFLDDTLRQVDVREYHFTLNYDMRAKLGDGHKKPFKSKNKCKILNEPYEFETDQIYETWGDTTATHIMIYSGDGYFSDCRRYSFSTIYYRNKSYDDIIHQLKNEGESLEKDQQERLKKSEL